EIFEVGGQLYMLIKFEHGEQKMQLTFDPNGEKTRPEARNDPLSKEWQTVWRGSNPQACSTDGLGALGSLEGLQKRRYEAGEKVKNPELEQLDLTLKDIDKTVGDLRAARDAGIKEHG